MTKKKTTAKTETTTKELNAPGSQIDVLVAEATELCRELLVWARRQNTAGVFPGPRNEKEVGAFQPLAQTVPLDKQTTVEGGMTEEESMKKMIFTVQNYLTTHQKADVQAILASKFNVQKTAELTHEQRVELIRLLGVSNGTTTKEKVWA